MPEFFQLSTAERLDALDAAANASGFLPHLLEKDIWVVWSLRHLFAGPYADHLVFKGGTSLSKAYGVATRGTRLIFCRDRIGIHLQSSTCNPLTRLNSPTFEVTTTRPRASPVPAISASYAPMGCPVALSAARMAAVACASASS